MPTLNINNDDIRLNSSSSDKVVVTGNLGIGTTSPQNLLHLRGGAGGSDAANLRIDSTNEYGGLVINENSTFRTFLGYGNSGNIFSNAQTDSTALRAANYLHLGASSAATITIDSNDRVGIGTTSPTSKLFVLGTGTYNTATSEILASDVTIFSSEMSNDAYNSILQLVSVRQSLTTGNASNGFLGFSTIDDSNAQGIRDAGRIAIVNEVGSSRNSATSLSFWTNAGGTNTTSATEKVRITSGGNVGIGTTSPDTPLFVQGGPAGTGSWNRTATLSATYPGLIFNSNGTKWGGMAYDFSAAMRFWVNANNNDIFAGTLALSILNNGNVGIGTTSPSSKLSVEGTASIYSSVSGNFTSLSLQNTSTSVSARNILQFSNNVGAVGLIDVFGGNWSPTGGGDDVANGFRILGLSDGGLSLRASTSTIRFYTGSSERMRITSAGDVAINTTDNALAKLRVVGNGDAGNSAIMADYGNTSVLGEVSMISYRNSQWHTLYVKETGSSATNAVFVEGTKPVIFNAGNVGIGTTSPSSILDASLSSGSTSGFRFKGYSDAGTPYLLSLGTETYPDVFQVKSVNGLVTMGVVGATGAAPDLVLQTNTTERMRITTAGNVGIGATSPQTRLQVVSNIDHVSGDISINKSILDLYNNYESDVAEKGAILTFSDNYYDSVGPQKTIRAAIKGGTQLAGNTADGFLAFYTDSSSANSATERVRINASGNVGIGTTSPSDELTVNSAGNSTGIAIQRSGTTKGLLEIGSSSDTFAISATSSTGILTFATNSSEQMRITSAGNVGIGTTSPFGTAANRTVLSVNGTTDVSLNVGTSGAQRAYLYGSSTYAELGTIGALPLTLATDNNEKMRITSAGNVGIGTTSPAYKLGVVTSGTLGFNIVTANSTVGGPAMDIYDTGRAQETVISSTDGTTVGTYIASYTNHPLLFNTNAGSSPTAKMILTTGGNVGIGTISPTAKLEIRNDDGGSSETVDKFSIRGGDGGNNQIMKVEYLQDAGVLTLGYAGLTGDSVNLNGGTSNVGSTVALNNDGTTKVFFHSNGNSYFNAGDVGIGTTAPQQLLHVLGATNGYMMVQGANDAGQAGIYFKKEDTTGTMDRTKGLIVFHTNVGSGFGRGHLGFCLNSADSNTVVSISDEKFRMVDNGDFLADGDVVAYSTTISDERYKTNITPIDSALDKVNQMRGVSFDWTAVRSGREFGVIAQEIEKIAPEVVSEKELLNGETMKTVSYTSLVPFLIESIKELTQQVNELKAQLDGLTK